MQANQSKRLISGIAATIVVGALAGAWHQRYSLPHLSQLDLVPHQLLQAAVPSAVSVNGANGDLFQGEGVTTPSGRFSILWRNKFHDFDGTTLIQLRIQELKGTCTRAQITGTNEQEEERTASIYLLNWRGEHDFAWRFGPETYHGKLNQLRLEFECTSDVGMLLSSMGIYEASLGRRMRDRAIQRTQYAI